MNHASQPRATAKIIGDLLDAANAAAEIVARGKDAWDHDRLLRLAGEAAISRIGDAAAKLPDDIKTAIPSVPWDHIRANRVLVAHVYHRIDYEILWATLARDVPSVAADVETWQSAEMTHPAGPTSTRHSSAIRVTLTPPRPQVPTDSGSDGSRCLHDCAGERTGRQDQPKTTRQPDPIRSFRRIQGSPHARAAPPSRATPRCGLAPRWSVRVVHEAHGDTTLAGSRLRLLALLYSCSAHVGGLNLGHQRFRRCRTGVRGGRLPELTSWRRPALGYTLQPS